MWLRWSNTAAWGRLRSRKTLSVRWEAGFDQPVLARRERSRRSMSRSRWRESCWVASRIWVSCSEISTRRVRSCRGCKRQEKKLWSEREDLRVNMSRLWIPLNSWIISSRSNQGKRLASRPRATKCNIKWLWFLNRSISYSQRCSKVSTKWFSIGRRKKSRWRRFFSRSSWSSGGWSGILRRSRRGWWGWSSNMSSSWLIWTRKWTDATRASTSSPLSSHLPHLWTSNTLLASARRSRSWASSSSKCVRARSACRGSSDRGRASWRCSATILPVWAK